MAEAAPGFLFVAALPASGAEVTLAGDEAHHLARVVRARPGERVIASDGAGGLAMLEVLEVRPHVRLRVLSREQRARERRLELWCGAPEGDRADWLVEKLGELGAAVLQPIHTERASWERASARAERWQRLTIAALKQSRSPWRLEIREPVSLAAALASLDPAALRLVAAADGGPAAGVAWGTNAFVIAAIGPSPGFSAEERKRLGEGGFAAISLSASRLRAETAALAVAAAWAAASGASDPGGGP